MAGARKQHMGPSLLEWIAAAVGLVVTAGLLVLLGFEASGPAADRPPLLEVQPVAITSSGSGHVVEVKVVNRSGTTAAGVQIEGELGGGGEPAETSTATVDYVPAHSQRNAGLLFREDPRKSTLKLRATGYQQP